MAASMYFVSEADRVAALAASRHYRCRRPEDAMLAAAVANAVAVGIHHVRKLACLRATILDLVDRLNSGEHEQTLYRELVQHENRAKAAALVILAKAASEFEQDAISLWDDTEDEPAEPSFEMWHEDRQEEETIASLASDMRGVFRATVPAVAA